MATKPYVARALASYGQATVIVPSDTVDQGSFAALYVGATGDISAILAGMTTAVLFKAVPIGFFPCNVTRVLATNTTATLMLGMN